MSSTFGTINLGLSGLQAHRAALDVAGQNVTNVNTPGYHRRQAVLTSVEAAQGSGTRVALIRRVEDGFLTPRQLQVQSQVGGQETSLELLQVVQRVFGEPSDTGLSAAISKFYNAFHELSGQPDSPGARVQVLQAGQLVAQGLRQSYASLQNLRDGLQGRIDSTLDSFNEMAARVAGLNQAIAAAPDPPHDLIDQRQETLRQMAALAPLRVVDGGQAVLVGGRVVVQGENAVPLALEAPEAQVVPVNPPEGETVRVPAAALELGQLAALAAARDDTLPRVLGKLDALATALAESVNALHRSGYGQDGSTGEPFFVGTGAEELQVNPALLEDSRKLAAGAKPEAPGDGSNALAMAQLQDSALVEGRTVGQAYIELVSETGAAVQAAGFSLEQSRLELEQLDSEQASLTGVSLDEEAATILQSQQAYNASARLISVTDEMVTSLLNLVGR